MNIPMMEKMEIMQLRKGEEGPSRGGCRSPEILPGANAFSKVLGFLLRSPGDAANKPKGSF